MSVTLRAAGAHGGERLVARRVEEGHDLVAVVHLVGADVLGDAACLAGRDLGLADRVEQRRLAVVDVPHDRDHRRARRSRSSSASSNTGSAVSSSAARTTSTFLSSSSASTPIASSDSVWVIDAISPSCISFLITSATWMPEVLGDVTHGGAGGNLDRLRLDDRGRPARLARLGRRCAAAAAAAAPLRRRRVRCLAAGGLGVDHDAAPAPTSASASALTSGTTATLGARLTLGRGTCLLRRRGRPWGAWAAARASEAGPASVPGPASARLRPASVRPPRPVAGRSRYRRPQAARAPHRPRRRSTRLPSPRRRPHAAPRGGPCSRPPSPSLSRRHASSPLRSVSP